MSIAVSHIGEGLSSCLEVPELQNLTSLRSLCLHGNNIGKIEGMQHLQGLQDLNLSSNCISSIESLHYITTLTSINLASNKLRELSGLDGLLNLTSLNVSYNAITSLSGLSVLQGPQNKLKSLDVRHNQISNMQSMAVLVGCMNLRELGLMGNPVTAIPGYQQLLLNVVPQITHLDGSTASHIMSQPVDLVAAQQAAVMQLASYQWPPSQNRVHAQHQGRHASDTQGASSSTPSIDAAMSAYHQWQGALSPPGATSRGNVQQSHSTRLPANSGQHSMRSTVTAGHRSLRGGDKHINSHDGGWQDPAVTGVTRIYIVDAAVQTEEGGPGLVKQLQRESALLKDQLTKLTDELERRNVVENQTHHEMQAAIQAVEEEAHARIEAGFKDAAQAVARALQELEASRVQGQQAQEQVAVHIQREQEAVSRCLQLEKDLARLQSEIDEVHRQAQNSVSDATRVREAERQAVERAERKMLDQIQALQEKTHEQDLTLSSLRTTLAAAEQRASSAEAAQQHNSSSAMSLTSKLSLELAEAQAQMEKLKSQLVSTQQQLTDQQQMNTESRAEINMLTMSLTHQQQHHQQALEKLSLSLRDELQLAVERERSAAEERGRSSVLLQAEREKGAVQEQLTVLKVQLQYALKESEREVTQLQHQLQHSQEEVQELRSALQAAGSRTKELDALLADLTNVLQQQKSHIQVLQRDKEALTQQLRAHAPERFQRLVSENQSLRTGNAELGVLKEQIQHHKAAWQESERKLNEMQVSFKGQLEESQARAASLEASLTQTREEARAAVQRSEGLLERLHDAEDAVKVKMAMLDSANDTVEQLKAEVSELQGEIEDSRRMAEDMESQLRTVHEQDGTEKSNLRAEIEASEVALDKLSKSLAEAQMKARDAEARLKSTQDALTEKEAMINYVNEEVDRVKGLFEKREGRLRDERDAARQQLDVSIMERDAAESRAGDLNKQLQSLRSEIEEYKGQLHGSEAAKKAAEEEASKSAIKLRELEEEMRQLLDVVEQQKKQSATKLKQLAHFLQEL
ncbi:hypothetical protein CEUSTIGMA_g1458.t1 [Chlamydomonas eustigma]|uniref:Uncharacterized protein n=1 Tax=Chlamydomonas eustigma TaxID=1157962 RepID=A0A250WT42_9CHLO|nr:hypothetical protein CEUSTIGMA_g1458.t1 [Chlamydomonas eustigma]|eukprot:GAX74008.1 hypothetical protein CEUSTIGMA_g1458.t1 [Chlamydomonas eustigma]